MRPSPLALLLAAAVSTRAADNPDDPTGKALYITEPSCGYFECIVTWKKGSNVAVNWLGPPPGQVSVQLYSQDGGPSYTAVDSIASISQEGYCNSGAGYGVVQPGVECGRIDFVVPGGWEERTNYTIAVQSLSDPSLVGYTDDITIAAAAKANADSVPSGTQISLLTIPAPTSTNYNGARDPTVKNPAPTAVTGRPSSSQPPSTTSSSSPPSSSSASSSRRASSSGSLSSLTPLSSADVTSPASSLAALPTSAASLAQASSSAQSSIPSSGAGSSIGMLRNSVVVLGVVLAGLLQLA